MKLVEEYSGVGDLSGQGEVLQNRQIPGILGREWIANPGPPSNRGRN
jgi:hypothetical protein